jgi:hypothetical protein
MSGNPYFSKQQRVVLWCRLHCARPKAKLTRTYAVGCLRAKEKFSKQHEFFAVGSRKSVYWNTTFKALQARLYAFEVLRGRQQNKNWFHMVLGLRSEATKLLDLDARV